MRVRFERPRKYDAGRKLEPRLIGLDVGRPPLVLALNSSATHFGFATGALFGGLVVDAGGAGRLWLLASACCAAALILHATHTREVRS